MGFSRGTPQSAKTLGRTGHQAPPMWHRGRTPAGSEDASVPASASICDDARPFSRLPAQPSPPSAPTSCPTRPGRLRPRQRGPTPARPRPPRASPPPRRRTPKPRPLPMPRGRRRHRAASTTRTARAPPTPMPRSTRCHNELSPQAMLQRARGRGHHTTPPRENLSHGYGPGAHRPGTSTHLHDASLPSDG